MTGTATDTGSAAVGGGGRWLRPAMVAMVAVLPFVCFPGIEHPFSRPKFVLLATFVAIAGIAVLCLGRLEWAFLPRGFRLFLLAWPAAQIGSSLSAEFLSPEALWLSLCCVGWFVLLIAVRPSPAQLATALVAATAAGALLVGLQYLRLDPLRLLGWTGAHYGSPRMRIVGTLGNPNFVAAVLAAGMPLTLRAAGRLRRRTLSLALTALVTAAILATGSRAAIAAVVAALAWLGALGQLRRWRWVTLVPVAAVVAALFLPQRSLRDTLRGRLYIWSVTVPHVAEHPLRGSGPGAFAPQFIRWETAYWRAGLGSERERQFADLQAHAHNDYLEILVDSGLAGLLSFACLAGSFLGFAFRQARGAPAGYAAGASAGVVALLTVAVVDFPLHRPAALFLFWTLLGLVYLEADPRGAGRLPGAVAGQPGGRSPGAGGRVEGST